MPYGDDDDGDDETFSDAIDDGDEKFYEKISGYNNSNGIYGVDDGF